MKGPYKEKPKGLILDLRDNGGGILQAAVDCAGLFLPKQSLVVSTKNRAGNIIDRSSTTREPLIRNLPIIILVNGNTASSAEVLAQALRIHAQKNQSPLSPHVFIIGTQTHGKGSVQEVKPLSNNCALKITTAHYYLPDNASLHERGIKPDILLKPRYRKITKQLSKEDHPKTQAEKSMLSKELSKDDHILSACNMLQILTNADPQNINSYEKAHRIVCRSFAVPHSAIAQKVS